MYPRTMASTGRMVALRTQMDRPWSWSRYFWTSAGISSIELVRTWLGMCLVSGCLARYSKKKSESAVSSLPLFGMPCRGGRGWSVLAPSFQRASAAWPS